jgi:hypothetical protein
LPLTTVIPKISTLASRMACTSMTKACPSSPMVLKSVS